MYNKAGLEKFSENAKTLEEAKQKTGSNYATWAVIDVMKRDNTEILKPILESEKKSITLIKYAIICKIPNTEYPIYTTDVDFKTIYDEVVAVDPNPNLTAEKGVINFEEKKWSPGMYVGTPPSLLTPQPTDQMAKSLAEAMQKVGATSGAFVSKPKLFNGFPTFHAYIVYNDENKEKVLFLTASPSNQNDFKKGVSQELENKQPGSFFICYKPQAGGKSKSRTSRRKKCLKRKIRTGKNGGKYYIKKSRKVYI
jgi:hypothetical protein